MFDEAIDPDLINSVVEAGYAADVTDDEIESWGVIPFLIAYGLSGKFVAL